MGTTEESAVDPLDEILKIRDQLKKQVRQSFFNIRSNNVINFSLSFIWSKWAFTVVNTDHTRQVDSTTKVHTLFKASGPDRHPVQDTE